MLTLYDYFRSSAAYRVRIALNLKGLAYCPVPINLVTGAQRSADYLARNPQGLVPALALESGELLTQSVAILEYIEERWPTPPLLPSDSLARARVRALAAAIGCDTHPLNNLRVLKYLTGTLQADESAKTAWYHHWIAATFSAIEPQLEGLAFASGKTIGLADCYLVPQVYNARRFAQPMHHYPNISRIYQHCLTLPAVAAAAPEQQSEAS